jgi:hypothetical protein
MQVTINAQNNRFNDHTPELKATRKKFAEWDCFTLHGTDRHGQNFTVEFYMDSGQQFEMATEYAYNHPDNPKNQLKED